MTRRTMKRAALLTAIALAGGWCAYTAWNARQTETTARQLLALNAEISDENTRIRRNEASRYFEHMLDGRKIAGHALGTDGSRMDLGRPQETDVLYFCFSDRHCSPCIESELENLDGLVPPGGSVVLLFQAPDLRELKRFRANNKPAYPVYKTDADLDSLLPRGSLPYYFVAERGSGRINSAFVPYKETPDSTRAYLERTLRKYDLKK